MITRYEVRLNNVSLTDVSEAILITDIDETDADEQIQAEALGYADGSRLIRAVRKSAAVKVTFAIRERDIARRAQIFSRVQNWARCGGWLTVSDRLGQRLYVERVELPSLGSAQRWTEELTAAFAAYSKPFWESAFPVATSIATAVTSGNAAILPPGNGTECTVDAEITAVGGAVNALTVTAGDTSMVFASLGLAIGQTLKIDHTDDGVLAIRVGDTSMMNKRTGASADELLLEPGKSGAVGFAAAATCTAAFRTRGRWN